MAVMAAAIAQSLPPELLRMILLHFRLARTRKRREPRHENEVRNERTMFSCSLVCRRWRAAAVSLLFVAISMDFKNGLGSSPCRNHTDAHLGFLLRWPSESPSESICYAVRSIKIIAPRPRRSKGAPVILASRLLTALQGFPRLSVLRIDGMYSITPMSTKRLLGESELLRLKHVTIDITRHGYTSILPFLSNLIPICASIDTIHLVGSTDFREFLGASLITQLRRVGVNTLIFDTLRFTHILFDNNSPLAIDSVQTLDVGRGARWSKNSQFGKLLQEFCPNVKHLIYGEGTLLCEWDLIPMSEST